MVESYKHKEVVRVFMRFFNPAKIRDIRTENGLSQTEMGRLIGCTKQMASQIENGTTLPGVNTLARIAELFDVDVDTFFTSNLTDVHKCSRESPAPSLKGCDGGCCGDGDENGDGGGPDHSESGSTL